jgi:predicted Fe-Mo cluster-binding NifX family protein
MKRCAEQPRRDTSALKGDFLQAGKTIVDQQVDALITGHCGPKASNVLQKAGTRIMTGACGKVTDAIVQFKAVNLKSLRSYLSVKKVVSMSIRL